MTLSVYWARAGAGMVVAVAAGWGVEVEGIRVCVGGRPVAVGLGVEVEHDASNAHNNEKVENRGRVLNRCMTTIVNQNHSLEAAFNSLAVCGIGY